MPPNKEIVNYVYPANLLLLTSLPSYCPLRCYLSGPGFLLHQDNWTRAFLSLEYSPPRYLHGLQSYLIQIFIQMSPF